MKASNSLTQIIYDHSSPCSFVLEHILQNAIAAVHLDLLSPSRISLCEEPFSSRNANITGCYFVGDVTGCSQMWTTRLFREFDAKIKFGTLFSLIVLLSSVKYDAHLPNKTHISSQCHCTLNYNICIIQKRVSSAFAMHHIQTRTCFQIT